MKTTSHHWLLLLLSLPSDQATLRVRLWRALKGAGGEMVRDGVHLLPNFAPGVSRLEELVTLARQGGGKAWLLPVAGGGEWEESFQSLFDRSPQYREMEERLLALDATLEQEPGQGLEKTWRELGQTWHLITENDFFPGPGRERVEERLARLGQRVARILFPGEPEARDGEVVRLDKLHFQERLWVTRSGLWIDRLASAWLILRHVDPLARFAFFPHPEEQAPENAVGFDFDGAPFSHVGEKITFQVIQTAFALETPPLLRLGRLIHALDTDSGNSPEAAGIATLLVGAKKSARGDDHALLDWACRLFDTLLAGLEEAQIE